jgi:class I fructose-bisphosphate aldolase
VSARLGLDQLGLSAGQNTRLRQILYGTGCRTERPCSCPMTRAWSMARGTSSPIRPRATRKYVIGLALEGGFNGIVIQIGLAEKFYWDYAGEIPLVLKLNGKTDIPSAIDPLSPVNATAEDAVRLGADGWATPCT